MSVTSTTHGGLNVWQFSGAVTDAEIKTAWSALIVNGRYKPARFIYIDSTCDLRGVRGAYNVDCEALGFILHSSRNKTNTILTNWFISQTLALTAGTRFNFVRVTNGTTVSDGYGDGLDMKGGAFLYDVPGTSANETRFSNTEGTSLISSAHTTTELAPSITTSGVWRGITTQKATPVFDSVRKVLYRCYLNTETASGTVINAYAASVCYVGTLIRRAGNAITSGTLGNTIYSNGTQVIMILNNYKDETFFGASKTTLSFSNWNAGNRVIGGVLKKIDTVPSTLINVYDSRSTTTPQKSTFSESATDFLSGTTGTTTDASTGQATFVVVGAIATGASIAVTRYSGQQYTLQKFGYRVQVEQVDMNDGDDDLSAFAPITMTQQLGITRTQQQITDDTTIDTLHELMEELHVLAIGLTGSASYSGAYSGNLFEYVGDTLVTSFASVTVDPAAANKISFDSATNSLTVKASALTDSTAVANWSNTAGPITVIGEFSANIVGNVIQATPVNMGGVTVTGNLTYNTNTNTTVYFSDTQVSGTVSNSGTGIVNVVLTGSASIGTAGTNVTVTTQTDILALDPQNFGTTWVLGWIKDSDYTPANKNNAPNTWTGWNQKSGTGNSTTLSLLPNTGYQLFLRVPGYYTTSGPASNVNTGTQSFASINLEPDRDTANVLLWPQTAAHATQASNFSFNMTTAQLEYLNAGATTDYISFLAAYRALEIITNDPGTAYDYIQPVYLNGTRNGFFVPRSSPIYATMKSTSTAGAILQADISYPDNGQPAYDRIVSTTPHLYLLTIQPTAAVSAFTMSTIATQSAAAVKPDLAIVNENVKKASLLVPASQNLTT